MSVIIITVIFATHATEYRSRHRAVHGLHNSCTGNVVFLCSDLSKCLSIVMTKYQTNNDWAFALDRDFYNDQDSPKMKQTWLNSLEQLCRFCTE